MLQSLRAFRSNPILDPKTLKCSIGLLVSLGCTPGEWESTWHPKLWATGGCLRAWEVKQGSIWISRSFHGVRGGLAGLGTWKAVAAHVLRT